MIDLRTDAVRIRAWLLEGVRGFGQEQPQTSVATLALHACPWAGWVTLALDTREHSDAHVAHWAPKVAARNIAWSGTDARGTFCDNAPDFAFRGWRELDCDHWRSAYVEGAPVIVDLDGVTVRPPADEDAPGYEGDEGYNRPFHRALVSMLQAFQREPVVSELKKSPPFRLGVQMLDGARVTFWVG
jgi:hypothetical protein